MVEAICGYSFVVKATKSFITAAKDSVVLEGRVRGKKKMPENPLIGVVIFNSGTVTLAAMLLYEPTPWSFNAGNWDSMLVITFQNASVSPMEELTRIFAVANT